MNKKIIFSAGGTGGHIFPAINLMKHFFKKGYDVILVTDKRGQHFAKNNLKFKTYIIEAGTPTNKNIFKKFLSIFIVFYSLVKSIIILKKEKPNLALGFGGYVSFPISFISFFFKIPLFIYENNLTIGRANKYLLPFAKKIFVAKKIVKNFPNKYKTKYCEVGEILNKDIINYFNFKKDNKKEKLSILVLGGSQGAKIFGKIVPPAIRELKKKGYTLEVNQQCTKDQKNSISQYYEENSITNNIFEFDSNILKLLLSTDLAITRCGASTTAELAYTRTPFIAVPLPYSIDNHQHLNAQYYNDNGFCWLLEENNFNTNNLSNLIIKIFKKKNKLEDITTNMKPAENNNSYKNIENTIRDFI